MTQLLGFHFCNWATQIIQIQVQKMAMEPCCVHLLILPFLILTATPHFTDGI